VAARSRWASPARLLVCRRTGLVVPKIPRGPAVYGPSARDGPLCSRERKTKERGSPVCSTRDQFHLSDELRLPNRGVRERPNAISRLPRGSGRQNSFCCGYRKDRCWRNWHRPQCVCRQRGCAWGVATAGQSSFSQLRLSVIQAKDSSPMGSYVACENIVNACQEYEELGSLATAKLGRKGEILDLAHPPARGRARIYWRFTRGAC